MASVISTIAIIVAIIGLIYLAYCGVSIILVAPLLAVVASIGCGQPLIDILGKVYFVSVSNFKQFTNL